MRFVLLVLVALAGTADARVKVQIASPGDLCRRKPVWDEVMTCLQGHGATTIERVLPKVRLVRVVQDEGTYSYDHGLYLYVQRDDRAWEFVSMMPAENTTVLGMTPQTIAGRRGYHLSLGQLYRTKVLVDGETPVGAIVATQQSVFCSGNGNDCATVTTHCEVLYRGRALWTFRGRVTFETGAVVNSGDRSHGGIECSPEDRIPLVWPTS